MNTSSSVVYEIAAMTKRINKAIAAAEKAHPDLFRYGTQTPNPTDEAERALTIEGAKVREAVLASVRVDDYVGAVTHMATLKPFVDTFFDRVMVADPDHCQSRVRLLMEVVDIFGIVADFSKIQ